MTWLSKLRARFRRKPAATPPRAVREATFAENREYIDAVNARAAARRAARAATFAELLTDRPGWLRRGPWL